MTIKKATTTRDPTGIYSAKLVLFERLRNAYLDMSNLAHLHSRHSPDSSKRSKHSQNSKTLHAGSTIKENRKYALSAATILQISWGERDIMVACGRHPEFSVICSLHRHPARSRPQLDILDFISTLLYIYYSIYNVAGGQGQLNALAE